MDILEQLRPEPVPLDVEWSSTTLRSILATPAGAEDRVRAARAARRRRRTKAAIAVLAGTTVITASAAYAGGMVPQFVSDAFSDLDGASSLVSPVSEVKAIADFTVPDGTRVEVWRGENSKGGSCEVLRQTKPGDEPEEHPGASCFVDESAAHYEVLSFGWVQHFNREDEALTPMYFYTYGEAPVETARQVSITGYGTDTPDGTSEDDGSLEVTLPVNETTLGFGGHLTGLTPAMRHVLTYTFLDSTGEEVATLTRG